MEAERIRRLCRRAPRAVFLGAFVGVVTLINGAYFSVLSFNTWQGAANAWFLEVVAFVVAYDCAELVLVLLMSERRLPRLATLVRPPRVALVCCTCDDADVGVLAALCHQTYANLRVFVLDDSRDSRSREVVDRTRYAVVRRANRGGFKAGNLNNWLQVYGEHFDYVAIADADSILPPTFVAEMVAHLEHPVNKRIGILESCIHPWNSSNAFAHLVGVNAVVSRLIALRAAAYVGATLSVGHNNVVRLRALRAAGGFDEGYLAEDYALAIALRRSGDWTCETADVLSFERVPENLSEYARRHARWAFQTFQLLAIDTSNLPFGASMRLIRALAYYAEPLLLLAAFAALTLWNVRHLDASLPWWSVEMSERAFMPPRLLALGLALLLPAVVRLGVMKNQRVPIGVALRSLILNAALACSVAWPIARRLLGEIFWRPTGFDVTGRSDAPTIGRILRIGAPIYLASWAVVVTTLVGPAAAYWNLFWALPGAMAPWFIWRYQRCQAPMVRE